MSNVSVMPMTNMSSANVNTNSTAVYSGNANVASTSIPLSPSIGRPPSQAPVTKSSLRPSTPTSLKSCSSNRRV